MSTTRTSGARKPARAASSAPIQLKSRPKRPLREPLFSIDDVEYTMPVTVELGESIMLAALLRRQPDEDAKGVELVRYLCGPIALNALMGDATMTRTEWEQIVAVLSDRAFGAAEQEDEAEGN